MLNNKKKIISSAFLILLTSVLGFSFFYSKDFFTRPGFLILYLLIVLLIILIGYLNISPLNPVIIFSISWWGGLGLSRLKLSYWQIDFGQKSSLVFVVSAIAFYLGAFIVSKLKINNHYIQKQIKKEHDILPLILVLFFVALCAYSIEVIKLGTIPAFSSNLAFARKAFVIAGIDAFATLMILIPSLCIIRYRNFQINKTLLITISLISIILLALTHRRFLVVESIIFLSSTFFLLGYRLNKMKIIGSILILVMVGFYMNNSSEQRFEGYGDNYIVSVSNIKENSIIYGNAFLSQAYMYVAMNFDNMAVLIDNNFHPSQNAMGLYSIPILSSTPLVDYAKENHIINGNEYASTLIIPSFNVFGYLLPYYLDFGIFGTVVFPFLIGLFSMLIFIKVKSSINNGLWIMLYSITIFGLIFVFFTNYFAAKQATGTIFFMVVSIIVFYVKLGNNRRKNTSLKS